MRSRRLEAEFAEEKQGPRVLGNFLGAIDDRHFARFSDVNLNDSASVTFRVASAGQGGTIELRSAAPDGPLCAQVQVPPTGGWEKWVEITRVLSEKPARRGDIYVVFVNPGKGGLMNLDWIEFHEDQPAEATLR